MFGAGEDFDHVLLGEVGAEHEQAREVELAEGDGVTQRREASDEARSGNPAKGFVFREPKLVDAIDVKARARSGAVNATGLDLAEVREELGEKLVRAPNETARAGE